MAMNLAQAITFASRLGKTALNQTGRRLAYEVKGAKLSNGLLHFGEYFKVVAAEHDPRFGILLLIRLPDGRGAHIPLPNLSADAQRRIHRRVVEILEGGSLPLAA
jgi:hypothetical protein